MIAIGKPIVAAFVARIGHSLTFLLVSSLYLLGYVLVGTSSTFSAIYAGSVIYAGGYTALQILLALLVADTTSLRYRGLSNALLAAPFLINVAASAQLLGWVLPDWRMGYTILALVVPLSLLPAAWVLRHPSTTPAATSTSPAAHKRMDWIGILLGGAGLTLLLLTPYHVVGLALSAAFVYHECSTRSPLIPLQLLRNPPVLAAALISLADFASFYLQFVYLYPFLLVVTDWSPRRTTYALYTHAFAITIFGVVAGAILHSTRRFKPTLLSGLVVRLLGVLLMFPAIGSPLSAGVLLAAQILQGWGGGFASIASQVSAQASTVDVANATAFVLLAAELGNALGSAGATGIWNRYLPTALRHFLPNADEGLIKELFGSVASILDRSVDDPVRIGAMEAYRDVMGRLLWVAAALAVLPPLLCLFMTTDVRLSDMEGGKEGDGEGEAELSHGVRVRREEGEERGETPRSGTPKSGPVARLAEEEVNERTPLCSPTGTRPPSPNYHSS